jgi:biotin carboxyl carrier protein
VLLWFVTADGMLVPKELLPVFAQVDGDVSELKVDHGTEVRRSDPLLQLTTREHEIREKDLESKIRLSVKRLETIQDQMFSPEENSDAQTVQENIEALKAQVANYREQQAILKQITQNMTIVSPIDGQVITWDLKRRLVGRSIMRGQELLEVANVDGPWELVIELPVRRFGHFKDAMSIQATPRVTFLLAADTSKRYESRVVEFEEAASVNSSHEQFIKLRADIDSHDLKIDQARVGVTAKIYCGRTSLGYASQLVAD